MEGVKEEAGFESGTRLKMLIARARALPPLRVAVVHPVDALSLAGALAAAGEGLIEPVLIAPRKKLKRAAEAAGLDLAGVEIVDAPHSHAAAAAAVALAREGKAHAVMKGALHTDEVMAEAVRRDGGLRTERRFSHIYVMDAPAYPKLLFVTDAAINISPTLDEKRDIVQNAIDLAHGLGVAVPKVAILSAVELVYAKLPSTIDAAALCKMADRGQIRGGLLDGPLAIDNAISPEAARAKGLTSAVAGDADILIAPNIDAGNMLAKQLDYLGGAVAAGVVIGAKVPIILTSRAETTLPRVAACAVASLFARNRPEVLK
jgi:phosphate acetyltransferase